MWTKGTADSGNLVMQEFVNFMIKIKKKQSSESEFIINQPRYVLV